MQNIHLKKIKNFILNLSSYSFWKPSNVIRTLTKTNNEVDQHLTCDALLPDCKIK